MKIGYQREFKHNYLIIEPEEIAWQGYESQMMSRNQIDGLLRFRTRQMDTGIRFYYEITSRQPLARILENRNIHAGEIQKLILGIFGILERMDTYLLREENIFLDPEYLYVDPDNFRVWLCLIPGLQRNFAESFSKLLEYLLGSIDHQDKDSVVLAYGLYQETRKENYGMEDIMRLLRQHKNGSLEDRNQRGRDQETEQRDEWLYEVCEGKDRNAGDRREKPSDEWSKREGTPGGNSDRGKSGGGKARQKNDSKSRWKEQWRHWQERIFRKSYKKEEDLPVRVPWEMMFQEQEKDREERSDFRMPKQWNLVPENLPDKFERRMEKKEEPVPGAKETELLADFSSDPEQRMLRALDLDGTDIPISYYPFIIGKQENLVDFKLDRSTVSRLHLRIDREGEAYRIKDLNSTNGTMLCGKMLENNEEAELHTGDEVCIARYRYRFE